VREINILIINNKTILTDSLELYLKDENFNVIKATTKTEGLSLFKKQNFRLLILVDDSLTGLSNIEFCNEIREISDVPLIIISNEDNLDDRLLAFEAGADDYIFEPHYAEEILARTKALLKRTEKSYENYLSFNGATLILNPVNHEVSFFGEKILLTATEYKILLTLTNEPKRIFRREQLNYLIHSDESRFSNRVIDTHIKNLRNKFLKNYGNPNFIVTVYGLGYKFEEFSQANLNLAS
jgi:DNA-binding response OmpR family regulator